MTKVGDYQDKNTFAAQQRCNAFGNALLPRPPLRNAEKCADAQSDFARVYTMLFTCRRKQLAGD
jgi:hypothetical protein